MLAQYSERKTKWYKSYSPLDTAMHSQPLLQGLDLSRSVTISLIHNLACLKRTSVLKIEQFVNHAIDDFVSIF